jgi:hypothetical protein
MAGNAHRGGDRLTARGIAHRRLDGFDGLGAESNDRAGETHCKMRKPLHDPLFSHRIDMPATGT